VASDVTSSPLQHRPPPATLDQDAIEKVSEVLVRGEPVLHPAAADAAQVLAYCVQRLAESLEEPRTLRTPEHVRRLLEGLQDLLSGAADAVDAVARTVTDARARQEMRGTWTAEQARSLAAAAAAVRRARPALGDAAAAVDQLTYTGPPFDTEADRIRGLVDELGKRGAAVTFDPTATPGYRDSGGSGGWMLQFQLPQDQRHFQLFIGDPMSLGDALPFELAYDDVHPGLVVDYVLANLDRFVTDYVVDPEDEEQTGYVGPARLMRG
jgi:hypothetical protein